MIDPDATTETGRALGRQLAASRRAAGLTQVALARRVSYGRSTIANVETGRQNVPRSFWEHCDSVLNTSGQLLSAYEASAVLANERRAGTTRPLGRGNDTVLRAHPSPAHTAQDEHAPPVETAEAAVRHGPPTSRNQEVDPALVPHWTSLLHVLAASHNLCGSRQIHDVVVRESAVIRRYRRDAIDDAQFLGVEARWAEFTSWTAENLGNQHEAAFWLRRSLTLARRAEDTGMVAYIQMRQAQRAVERHDAVQATALADAAGHTAGLSHRDRALCALRQAEGHALAGARRACAAALEQAYRSLGRAENSGDDDPDTIGWHCVPSYVRAHEGYCLLNLGSHREATSILEDVLGTWPTEYRQDEALTRAWLALSYALTGRLADAGSEGARALTTTTASRSARTIRVLGQLHARLPADGAPQEVSAFRAGYTLVASAKTL